MDIKQQLARNNAIKAASDIALQFQAPYPRAIFQPLMWIAAQHFDYVLANKLGTSIDTIHIWGSGEYIPPEKQQFVIDAALEGIAELYAHLGSPPIKSGPQMVRD